jgi:L-fuconolactonase
MPPRARLQRLGQHVHPSTLHAPAHTAGSACPRWIIDCHTHFWCVASVSTRSLHSFSARTDLVVRFVQCGRAVCSDTPSVVRDARRGEAHSWPARDSPLTVETPVALPSTLEDVCPATVTGTVVVEAVYSVDDNHWMLGLSDQQHEQREDATDTSNEPLIVGLVGKLAPGSKGFHSDLESFASHRRFVGIRCGSGELLEAERAGVGVLSALAKHELELDFAGSCDDIRMLLSLLPAAPDLRVVINHMGGSPRFAPGDTPSVEWAETMHAAAAFPNVYMKVSAVFSTVGLRPEEDGEGSPVALEAYAPHLDLLVEVFGEERLIYGSDWPVCNGFGDAKEVYSAQLALLLRWAEQRGESFAEGLFWKNALAAYRFDTKALRG